MIPYGVSMVADSSTPTAISGLTSLGCLLSINNVFRAISALFSCFNSAGIYAVDNTVSSNAMGPRKASSGRQPPEDPPPYEASPANKSINISDALLSSDVTNGSLYTLQRAEE